MASNLKKQLPIYSFIWMSEGGTHERPTTLSFSFFFYFSLFLACLCLSVPVTPRLLSTYVFQISLYFYFFASPFSAFHPSFLLSHWLVGTWHHYPTPSKSIESFVVYIKKHILATYDNTNNNSVQHTPPINICSW